MTRDSGPPPKRVAPPAKLAWIAAGWLFVAVGIIGIVVPGLPTTGPMLIALACFARGSERLHQWLLNHPVFGPPIERWHAHRTISIRDKIVAVTMMLGGLVYVVWLSPLPHSAIIFIACLIAVGVIVVLRIPHTPPS